MSRQQRVVFDVPDERVDFVVAMMRADGAETSRQRQPDGRWTVTGRFPEPAPTPAPDPAPTPAAGPPAPTGPRPAGPAPAAPPTAAPAAPGADADHHVEVLARTIWGEARGGSRLGMEAVAACVLNRLRRKQPGRFGASVAEVCLKPLQFSCWNEGDPNLPKLKAVDERDERFRLCLEIARRAVAGTLADPVSGSDHYHTVSVSPAWSAGRRPVRRIDDHLFFNDVP